MQPKRTVMMSPKSTYVEATSSHAVLKARLVLYSIYIKILQGHVKYQLYDAYCCLLFLSVIPVLWICVVCCHWLPLSVWPPIVLNPFFFVSLYSNFIHSDSSREEEGGFEVNAGFILGFFAHLLITTFPLPHQQEETFKRLKSNQSPSSAKALSNWAWPWMWPSHLVSILAPSADWKAKKSPEIWFLLIYLCSVIPYFTWPSIGMVICGWSHCGRAPLRCTQGAGMCSTRSGLNWMALGGGGWREGEGGLGGGGGELSTLIDLFTERSTRWIS